MKNIKTIIAIIALVAIVGIAGYSKAQMGGGISNPIFWIINGSGKLTPSIPSQSVSVYDLEVSNAFTLSGTAGTGGINMNNEIITNIGNAGTDFTATGGLTLAQSGKLILYSNGQDNAGERLILQNVLAGDSTDSAKTMIAFKDINGNSKAWLVAHNYSSAASGGSLHKHFSIETSRADGGLYTRLEFPYDTNITEAAFNLSNLTITRNAGETNGNLYAHGALAIGQGSAYGSLDVNDINGTGSLFRGYGSIHPIELRRANGNIASSTIVANGNFLGQISAMGYDGANYKNATQIRTVVDGIPGTNDMPGKLIFLTTLDGTSTLQERMAIKHNGNVGINTSDPGTKLEVNGTFASSVDADTIADSGGAGTAAHSLTPSTSYVKLTCSDADGCDVTMTETGAVNGQIVRIVNSSANVCNFADTDGVSELAGVFAMGQYDTLELLYTTDRWVEISRSNN